METNQLGGCIVEAISLSILVGIILPTILENDLPVEMFITQLYGEGYRADRMNVVVQLTCLLERCRVYDWSILYRSLEDSAYGAKPKQLVDGMFRMVVRHPTIRKFTFFNEQPAAKMVLSTNVPIQFSGIEMGDAASMPHLVELLQNTNRLQRLTTSECGIEQSAPLFEAIDACESFGRTLWQCDVLGDIQCNALVRAAFGCTEWTDLDAEIEYCCDLNRIGRGRPRQFDVSKMDHAGNLCERETELSRSCTFLISK